MPNTRKKFILFVSNSRRSRKLLPGLYPALGRADARNQREGAPLSPPLIPHRVRIFLRKFLINARSYYILSNS